MAGMLWQCEAERCTPTAAVQEFARTYWAEPRKAKKLQADGTFQMVGGLATYQVQLIPADRFRHPAYFQITKLHEGAEYARH